MEPRGEDDELTEAETVDLGAIRTWARQLEHQEGAVKAERYLLAEICLAREEGRPASFTAALQQDLLAVQIDGGAAAESRR